MERTSVVMGSRIFSAIVPAAFAILGVLIANWPASFLDPRVPPPLLGLMAVYYWCLVRPDLMPPFWAFLIGLLEDLLSGGPPGVWTVSFVVTYAAIDRQRDAFAGLSGLGAMLGFATAATICCATAYITEAAYYWRVPPTAPVLGELAMSIFFYLPVVVILGFVHRRFVGASRSDF